MSMHGQLLKGAMAEAHLFVIALVPEKLPMILTAVAVVQHTPKTVCMRLCVHMILTGCKPHKGFETPNLGLQSSRQECCWDEDWLASVNQTCEACAQVLVMPGSAMADVQGLARQAGMRLSCNRATGPSYSLTSLQWCLL